MYSAQRNSSALPALVETAGQQRQQFTSGLMAWPLKEKTSAKTSFVPGGEGQSHRRVLMFLAETLKG